MGAVAPPTRDGGAALLASPGASSYRGRATPRTGLLPLAMPGTGVGPILAVGSPIMGSGPVTELTASCQKLVRVFIFLGITTWLAGQSGLVCLFT